MADDSLVVKDLSVQRLRKPVLNGVNLDIMPGERVALVGHNGAGKSTLLRTIIGLHTPTHGSIEYGGEGISGRPSSAIVKKGISLAPQAAGFFPNLTVAENLHFSSVAGAYLGYDEIYELFQLKQRRQQLVGTMSGGERQMVAISVALMAGPNLLMLDEPSLGLGPGVVDSVFESLAVVHQTYGVSLLVVEQNIRQAASFADRMFVLNQGRIVRSGPPREVMSSNVWELV